MVKNPTLKDVAEMAGVSVSTASRVLNDNYPVSAQVRGRVTEVVKALGYTPNFAARSLKTNKSDMIGLVVADIGSPFFVDISKGLESVVVPKGYDIVIIGSDGDVEKERRLLRGLLEKRVEALIIASADHTGQTLRRFEAANIPIVLVDRILPDIKADCVTEQNFETARDLTRLLIENGHRDIAIVNVLLSVSSGLERYEGYMAAHREAGLKPLSRNISGSNFTQEDARLFTHKVLSLANAPTALFCANNMMVAGTLEAIREKGLRVPDDISLVSFGEIEMQSLIDTKITCSIQNAFEMGVIAGTLAMEHISNKRERKPTMQYTASSIALRNSIKAL